MTIGRVFLLCVFFIEANIYPTASQSVDISGINAADESLDAYPFILDRQLEDEQFGPHQEKRPFGTGSYSVGKRTRKFVAFGKRQYEPYGIDKRPFGTGTFGKRSRTQDDMPLSKRPFGTGSFGKRPFGSGSFGKRRHGSIFFGKKSFGSSSFEKRPFGSSSFGKRPFGSSSFGKRPFGSSTFGKRPFGSESFGKRLYELRDISSPERRFEKRPFGSRSFGKRMHTASFAKRPFGPGAYGKRSYKESDVDERPFGASVSEKRRFGSISFGKRPFGGGTFGKRSWGKTRVDGNMPVDIGSEELYSIDKRPFGRGSFDVVKKDNGNIEKRSADDNGRGKIYFGRRESEENRVRSMHPKRNVSYKSEPDSFDAAKKSNRPIKTERHAKSVSIGTNKEEGKPLFAGKKRGQAIHWE